MTRTQIVATFLVAVLLLAGCQAKTSQSVPAKPAVTQTQQATSPAPDPVKEEDDRLKREMAEKKRKSKAYDLNKTDAYKNYVP